MPASRKSKKQRSRERRRALQAVRHQRLAAAVRQRVRRRIAKAVIDVERRYFVAHTMVGFERRARDRLAAQGLDVYAPLEEVERTRKGTTFTTMIPVLPRLLFVGIPKGEDGWLKAIQDTPGVSGLLRFGEEYVEVRPVSGRPHPLQEFADEIADEDEEGSVPTLTISVGDQIRVVDGPFAFFNGMVEGIDAKTDRVTVTVGVFSRATLVTLDVAQVELT